MEYLTFAPLMRLLLRTLPDVARGRPRTRILRGPGDGNPRVSVIIPTYNWSSVLRFAIGSVLWQTMEDFEIQVVGDGCSDDSEDVVRSFGDSRIFWTNLPRNSGSQSAANNEGLARARGEYIAYLGHDDLWHPCHLERLLEAVSGVDVASSLVEMIGPPGTNFRVVTGIYPPGGYDGAQGLPPTGLLHRREVGRRIGGWRDYRTIWRNPDVDFVYRAFEAGFRFASTGDLTAFKFNSALRKNSYVEKPCHEQASYQRQMMQNPFFLPREVLKIDWIHLRRLPMHSPKVPPPPDPHTPGWHVTQYRKHRGLE